MTRKLAVLLVALAAPLGVRGQEPPELNRLQLRDQIRPIKPGLPPGLDKGLNRPIPPVEKRGLNQQQER